MDIRMESGKADRNLNMNLEGARALDLENKGFPKVERNSKMFLGRTTMSGRKRLSDITNMTNLQSEARSIADHEKPTFISCTNTNDYISQLVKRNNELLTLLGEKNQMIELSGQELQKLQLALQKAHQQNWLLAQANTQILTELNCGKDKLKAFTHDLGCTAALLKAKSSELEEKGKLIKQLHDKINTEEKGKLIKQLHDKINTEERSMKCTEVAVDACHPVKELCTKISSKEQAIRCDEVAGDACHVACSNAPRNPNNKHISRNHSLGSSVVINQKAGKEKGYDRRKSLRRRSAANFKYQPPEHTEDLFEIEDAGFPTSSLLNDPMPEDHPTQPHLLDAVSSATPIPNPESRVVEHKDITESPAFQNQEARRTSIGRPGRRATVGVSYKEKPLNLKMRRSQ